MRRFRTQLASCWGIDKSLEELQRRLTQLEDAVHTTSTLRTQGLVTVLIAGMRGLQRFWVRYGMPPAPDPPRQDD